MEAITKTQAGAPAQWREAMGKVNSRQLHILYDAIDEKMRKVSNGLWGIAFQNQTYIYRSYSRAKPYAFAHEVTASLDKGPGVPGWSYSALEKRTQTAICHWYKSSNNYFFAARVQDLVAVSEQFCKEFQPNERGLSLWGRLPITKELQSFFGIHTINTWLRTRSTKFYDVPLVYLRYHGAILLEGNLDDESTWGTIKVEPPKDMLERNRIDLLF